MVSRVQPPQSAAEKVYDRMSIGVVLVVLFLVGLTFREYGITWDESYHTAYGDHIARFYRTGFRNTTAITFRIDYLYGGAFDAFGSTFRNIFGFALDDWQAIHLMGGLVGVLGVAGTWKLGRVLGGPRAGFLAVLMMATTSVYYGHMFNNPKDLPFAAGYAWGLYYLFALIKEFPRISRALAIKAAIAFGFAMAVRIGGLLIICYFVLAVFLWCLREGLVRRSAEFSYQAARQLLPRILAIMGGAWVVMLVWWPWALLDPVKRPLAAVTRMSEFIDHRRYMPFAGREVYNLEPPWDYLLHYFALKLPEYLVVGGVTALLVAIALPFRAEFRAIHFRRRLTLALLGLSVLFPPIYAVAKGSPLYDGLRHFLFIVPPIVAATALLLDRLLRKAEQHAASGAPIVIWACFGGLVADQAATMARLHPHQYVYFNRFIGGLGGAVGQYDTDYYGQTFKESADRLYAKLWETEPEKYLNTVYRVNGCIGEWRAMYYLPPNFSWGAGEAFDFHIGYTRGGCAEEYPLHPIITRVERDGGLLNLARDKRKVILEQKEVNRLRREAKAWEKEKKKEREKGKSKKGKPKRRTRPGKPPVATEPRQEG